MTKSYVNIFHLILRGEKGASCSIKQAGFLTSTTGGGCEGDLKSVWAEITKGRRVDLTCEGCGESCQKKLGPNEC